MTQHTPQLEVLLIEDDEETLRQFCESLPASIEGHPVYWDPCRAFPEALARMARRRYDLVVTDIYLDSPTGPKDLHPENAKALDIISAIRGVRFCPVVTFSSGSKPEGLREGPFVRFVDKAAGNQNLVRMIAEVLRTGVPEIARRLHDDLDQAAGFYLWGFLENVWEKPESQQLKASDVLERLVRRRASVAIGRLDPTADYKAEVAQVKGVEFYLCPPISGAEFRCGEIIRDRTSRKIYSVILTPHCHLARQAGQEAPRADWVLMCATVPVQDVFARDPVATKKEEKKLAELGRRLQSPARVGSPEGRYWFLPGFLEMPDLYCDLLQIRSEPIPELERNFERFAALDSPYAEGLQSCFTRLYSAVGLPKLDLDDFKHLLPSDD
jgi:CheY-like chemotaxis protein